MRMFRFLGVGKKTSFGATLGLSDRSNTKVEPEKEEREDWRQS